MRPVVQNNSDHEASSVDGESGLILYSDENMSEDEHNIRIFVQEESEEDVSEEEDDEDEDEECDETHETYDEFGDFAEEMEIDSEGARTVETENQFPWGGFENRNARAYMSSRSRSNSLATLLIPRSEHPLRAAMEKATFPKTNDDAAEQVLNNPPLFYRSWAYHSLSFLSPGRSFKGTQNQVSDTCCLELQDQDRWEVKVTIHSLDQSTGTVVGLMEALNVPVASSTVVTYWEGEVVDFVNHNLWTRKWGATDEVDIEHWKRFAAFNDLKDSLSDSSSYSEVYEKYIFMRWKEKFFVNILAHESGLTIAGFYYICISRADGLIEGFYYDPTSKPFQRLELHPLPEDHH
ncbi:hypothetical protein DSO57_1027313 [Entomophthora muscae]|uniref:Uncharacterized protein n=1 Tax=Entomophthora muscae TaxID=34485 RepID=A0ACC2RSS6_9FUNG|nr:hypothetical protein DSO57_1027313 [Entomophthora muscae]